MFNAIEHEKVIFQVLVLALIGRTECDRLELR